MSLDLNDTTPIYMILDEGERFYVAASSMKDALAKFKEWVVKYRDSDPERDPEGVTCAGEMICFPARTEP